DIIDQRDNGKCRKCKKEEHIANELDAYRDMTEQEKSEFLKKAKKEFLESESGKSWMELIGGFPKFGIPMVLKENYADYESVILNVHHEYYIKGKKPWEYELDALTTLCSNCHKEVHEKEIIRIYDNDSKLNSVPFKNCWKCNGTGRLPEYHYYFGGICFACDGKGTNE
ncbi:MAG: hypothetical protein GYB35_15605, partial [Algicola sp.]|nr:hypothetical protein [Algicola sp.]